MGDIPSTTASARVRPLLALLAIVDLALGGGALVAPRAYLALVHPLYEGPMPLLARTATLWLFFSAAEAAAAATLRRDLVLVVAALRLMDVPADLVYRATAPGLARFGAAALVAAPCANLALGLWLWRAAHRAGD